MSREKQKREMYNKELKTNFIRSYTKSIHTAEVAQNIFGMIGRYEREWGADVCTRSVSELQPAMDEILGLRGSSKWMALIILREYSRYCEYVQRYPGACDAVFKVNTAGLGKIQEQMVSSPLHLQAYFDKVFTPESDETLDNIYRCFLWMAYAGINEKDSLGVTVNDLDLTELRIVLDGVPYPIYREAIPAFKNAISLTSFVHRHPNYTKEVRIDRASGDTIIRGIRLNSEQSDKADETDEQKASSSLLTIRAQISKRLNEASSGVRSRKTKELLQPAVTNQTLSYHRVWLSGLFYRTYEMERAGLPISFSEIAAKDMERKTYTLSSRDSLRQKQNRKAREYAEDYQRWKLAFSI